MISPLVFITRILRFVNNSEVMELSDAANIHLAENIDKHAGDSLNRSGNSPKRSLIIK